MVITTIGHLAEVAWHHPEISASYAWVEVSLSSHDAGGITDTDLALAAQDRGGRGLAAGRRGRALRRHARRPPLRLRAPRRGLGQPDVSRDSPQLRSGDRGPRSSAAVLGQHRLGVELEADDRVLAVAERHDLALLAAGGDHQLVGEVLPPRPPASGSARRSADPGGRRRRPRRRGRSREALPCIGRRARTIWPPKAWPMHWWPRQTPEDRDRRARAGAPAARDTPASLGVQGPGEMTMCEGSSAAISSTVTASQRTTSVAQPSSRT